MQTHVHRSIRAFVFASLIAGSAHAQMVNERMLVSADWLRRGLGMMTVLHIGDRAEYDSGHIPGAVLVELSSLLVQRDGTPNELPPVAELERVFAAAGVGPRGRIIVYSRDPLYAARAWFTLDYLGQGDRTSLLDGGLVKWAASGYELSKKNVVPQPRRFEARVVPQTVMRIGAMRELVRLRERFGTALVLIDARPPAQFSGDEAGEGVKRAGAIPGAVNVPTALNFGADGAFRPASDLGAMYRKAGVTNESANVVYCRTGMQASVTYFVLRYLGFDAELYDGSYLEWSNAGEMIWS